MNISDLQNEMHDCNDTELSLQIQSAIQAAAEKGLIHKEDPVNKVTLGHIKDMIYRLNEEEDFSDGVLPPFGHASPTPADAAVQFIEHRMQQ